jgi:hypothetical protein
MTYPGRVDIARLLSKTDRQGVRGHANPRNLMGFLDAFKAVLASRTAAAGANVPSLTRCEDFA